MTWSDWLHKAAQCLWLIAADLKGSQMSDIVFHTSCPEGGESARLTVSVDGEFATPEQIDKVAQVLNCNNDVKPMIGCVFDGIESPLANALRKLEHQRKKVEEADATFDELVGPDEPTRFRHPPERDFDPAAQMRLLAAARDEARAELKRLFSDKGTNGPAQEPTEKGV